LETVYHFSSIKVLDLNQKNKKSLKRVIDPIDH